VLLRLHTHRLKIDNFYSKLENALLYSFKNEAELIKSIDELTNLFNFKRSDLNQYINDERLVSAYVMYFLSTNYKKLGSFFDLIPNELKKEMLETELIDWGTGPGTFLLAARMLGFEHCVGIDQSSVMIDQAQKVLEEFDLSDGVEFNLNKKKRSRTLLFSHSANEMELEEVQSIIKEIDPEFVLFIEPGTKESFQKIIKIRTNLLKSYNTLYPCPSNSACPMINQEDDWCHQVVRVTHEDRIESLCQKMRRDRRNMPTCFMLFSRKSFKQDNFRLLRKPLINKAKVTAPVCHDTGEGNEFAKVELLTRHLSKDQKKKMKKIQVGDRIDLELDSLSQNAHIIRGRLKGSDE